MKFALGPNHRRAPGNVAADRRIRRCKGLPGGRFRAREPGRGAWIPCDFAVYTNRPYIGAQLFGANLRHRLRWHRSSRRSRPKGYAGQIFTHPLPLALLLCACSPAWWPLLTAAAVLRAAAVWATAGHVLRDPLTRRRWWLVPVQDVANLLIWWPASSAIRFSGADGVTGCCPTADSNWCSR